MDKKSFWRKNGKWASAAIAAGLFGFAGITLHDMQTAEGTGLYLAICAGREDRLPFDLMVDFAGMLCLAGVILVPCLAAKRFHADSFLRLLSAYLAFLPVVSTASLAHLLDGTTPVTLRDSLLEGRIGTALFQGLAGPVSVLGVGLPVLLLAQAAGSGFQTGSGTKGIKISGLVCLLLLAAGLLFPALAEPCDYLIRYVLLLWGFVLWERLLDQYPGLCTWSWLLFGLFSLRGIDRMMEVMSVYHI